MKTVEIDAEIAKLQKTILSAEADQVRHVSSRDEAKATFERFSLPSCADGEEEATRAVEEARFDFKNAEIELEILASVIAQANRQLDVLGLSAKRPNGKRFTRNYWRPIRKWNLTSRKIPSRSVSALFVIDGSPIVN